MKLLFSVPTKFCHVTLYTTSSDKCAWRIHTRQWVPADMLILQRQLVAPAFSAWVEVCDRRVCIYMCVCVCLCVCVCVWACRVYLRVQCACACACAWCVRMSVRLCYMIHYDIRQVRVENSHKTASASRYDRQLLQCVVAPTFVCACVCKFPRSLLLYLILHFQRNVYIRCSCYGSACPCCIYIWPRWWQVLWRLLWWWRIILSVQL